MARVTFNPRNNVPPLETNCSVDTLKRKKRQVKNVTIQRKTSNEEWGLEISGNGWQDGEWIRKSYFKLKDTA